MNCLKVNYSKILTHILVWAALISLHYMYFPKLVRPQPRPSPTITLQTPDLNNPESGRLQEPPPPPRLFLVVLYVSLIAFYYLNALVFIPKFLSRQKRWEYGLIVLLCVVLFLILVAIPDQMMHPERPLNRGMIISSVLLISLVFIMSGIGRITDLWFQSEKRAQEIEYEKKSHELSLLKAQINPHFLFNTLNNIYTLASKKSDLTADAVLKLSEMMRYVISEAKEDYVPFVKEVEYLSRFIDLQKLRLTDKVEVNFQVIGNPEGVSVAPLILMPFVENTFKYGVSTHEQSTISISIVVGKSKVILSTTNQIFDYANILTASTNIGIANTRRRLDLLYPGKHKLQIDNLNNNYVVHLELIV